MDMLNPYKYNALEYLLFPPWGRRTHGLRQRLGGKNILITGASYGIGEQLACLLAATGARLILIARTEEKLQIVRTEVERLGGQADVFPCDLRNEIELQTLLEWLQQPENSVHVFVNNAGKSIRRSLLQSLGREHDFFRTMSLNYHAPVKICLGIIPDLIKNNGQIINISAANVLLLPAPYWAAYQASKAAFDQWFRCAAPELREEGVACSTLYLPLVRTRMIAPTEAYRNMPAMHPRHVADIICRIIRSRRRRFRPWWLIFGQSASFFLRGIGERMWGFLIKKQWL
jgi:short-subunit dehydrogenase